MRNRTVTTMAAAAALALLTAGPAAGQQHGHGEGHADREKAAGHHAEPRGMMGGAGGHMMGGMMGGQHGGAMHAAMAFGPGPMMLLHQREALELSEEQAGRLESLQAAMHERMETHHANMEEIHEAMEELSASESPDMGRFRELMQRMADSRVEMAVRMARTHRQAMEVLTPEQRSNARYGMELMHRMMRGGHGEMMGDHGEMMGDHGEMMDDHGGAMDGDDEGGGR